MCFSATCQQNVHNSKQYLFVFSVKSIVFQLYCHVITKYNKNFIRDEAYMDQYNSEQIYQIYTNIFDGFSC